MRIIKVDAIDSTNAFVKALYKAEQLTAAVCVVAHEQQAGKGQMGTQWHSNPGENLTCSVFMPIENLVLHDQFFISMAVSLAIVEVLDTYKIPALKIKWPNDILSDKQKICGILIESIMTKGELSGVIIGMGININQKEFPNLPRAISIRQVLGRSIEIEDVLSKVLHALQRQFKKLKPTHFESLASTYEHALFRKNKASTFRNTHGLFFTGIIQGVSATGKLKVVLENEIHQEFSLKEIELMY